MRPTGTDYGTKAHEGIDQHYQIFIFNYHRFIPFLFAPVVNLMKMGGLV
jgi:hypothetical protein